MSVEEIIKQPSGVQDFLFERVNKNTLTVNDSTLQVIGPMESVPRAFGQTLKKILDILKKLFGLEEKKLDSKDKKKEDSKNEGKNGKSEKKEEGGVKN